MHEDMQQYKRVVHVPYAHLLFSFPYLGFVSLFMIELLLTSCTAVYVLAAVSADNGQCSEGRKPAKISTVAP
jgi:hypothetical protein